MTDLIEPVSQTAGLLAMVRATHSERWARATSRAEVARALFAGTRTSPTVHRYRLRSILGRGGSGTVFCAHDDELGRAVALKLVDLRGRSPQAALREARALAAMTHPSCVEIFDVGVLDNHLWFAMELASSDLTAWLREHPAATWSELAPMLVDIAHALAHLHAHGSCHRDVKPSNILIRADGTAALGDFGLLAAAGDAARGGTLAYASPEQANGESVDARSDQYSFCVSVVEALTGSTHLEARSLQPRALRRIVARGLDPDPTRRFADMHAVAWQLERVRRPRWGRLSLFAVCGLAGAAWSMWPNRCAEPTTPWPAASRERLVGLDASQMGPAVVERLDAVADRWARAAAGTCLGAIDPCQRAQRMAFESTVEVLLEAHEPSRRAELVGRLEDSAKCVPGQVLAAPSPLEPDFARARALTNAGQYQRSAARLRALLGNTDLSESDRARAEVGLGEVLTTMGSFEAARPLLVAGHWRSMGGGLDATASDAAAALALIDGVHGTRYEHAEQWGRYALSHADRMARPELGRARAQYVLARGARARGRYSESRSRIEKALTLRRTAYGVRHPKVSAAMMELGNLEHDLGHHQAALRWLTHACETYRGVYGHSHPDYAACLMNLGLTQLGAGRTDDAAEAYEQALAIHRSTFGDGHYNVAASIAQLGDVAKRRGDLRLAAKRYREAIATFERSLDADHPRLVATHNDLGIVLGLIDDVAGAIEAYRHALRACERLGSARGRQAAFIHLNLGTALHRAGELASAEAEYRLAGEVGAEALSQDHPVVSAAWLNLGLLAADLDRTDARQWLKSAAESMARTMPPDHPHLAAARTALATL